MFTREELQVLAEGLDSLARNAKDVIIASVQLAPIRRKLDALAKSLDQPPEDRTKDAEDCKKDT